MTESAERVLFEVTDGVATITLNRPEQMNALDTATLREIDRALVKARADSEVRSIVLTGNGRAFCAGADVKEWAAGDGAEAPEAEPGEDWVTIAHRIVACLYRMPKPVVAAVNGVAVGAGLDLALACDFRLASDLARFGSVYIRLGIPPDAGASFFLPRIVGVTKAKELIYTGRIIGSAEAAEIGLVSRVVGAADLMAEVKAFAGELAGGPTIAIGMAKENVQELWNASIEGALRAEQRSERLASTTADHAEGLAAIGEKRAPLFEGR